MTAQLSHLQRWIPAILLGLAACTLSPALPETPDSTPGPSTATVAPTAAAAPTAATPPTADTATPAVAVPPSTVLRLWLPEQFQPDPASEVGAVLAKRLADFESTYPGLTIEVRIKRMEGRGGLLDSLSTASAAAPAALPHVVALNRADLQAAARDDLILPLTDILPAPEESGYFPFAVELADVDGVVYGLPFVGEGNILAYNRLLNPAPPVTWTDVISGTGPLLFPAGDSTSLFTLTQYLALGGSLRDEDGQPMLDGPLLAEVLAYYRAAVEAGVLSPAALDYADAGGTWRAYRESRAALATVPISTYLAERDQITATRTALIPNRDGLPYALADGWCWVLAANEQAGDPRVQELLAWLSAPAFLGEWTVAMNALPGRDGALDYWPPSAAATFTREAGRAAHLQPPADLLAVVGPAVQEAVEKVLTGQATPEAAAAAAAATVAPRTPLP